jgi:hypothetical protein
MEQRLVVTQTYPCLRNNFQTSNKEKKMEAISKFPHTHQPIRSISFPTRGNPSSQRIEEL